MTCTSCPGVDGAQSRAGKSCFQPTRIVSVSKTGQREDWRGIGLDMHCAGAIDCARQGVIVFVAHEDWINPFCRLHEVDSGYVALSWRFQDLHRVPDVSAS